tara:strand:+ start:3432 stop:4652 length:1221 start_codon:yes stop_codon:yes gene_type:complete
MDYLAFVRKEKRLLSFAVSFTFFSSFGQTFFISLFVPFYLVAFELSNASFGSLYSAATLTGAMILPYLGQWIDRISLSKYSLAVSAGLFFAAVLMSISWHISIFFISLILVRLTGQGLSSHTAQATMARVYGTERGKALSVSALGYPLGEAVLPSIITAMLVVFHWRTIWGIIAGVIALIFIPVVWTLIRTYEKRETHTAPKVKRSAKEDYKVILKDRRTLFIIPAILIPPFWATGLFLYQIAAADELGWSASLIATAFISFAIMRILFGIISGPLIDRFTACKLFPFYLIPILLGLLSAVYFSTNWSAFVYLGMIGVTMGLGSTIKSALLAEMYGSERIGTVQSLFTTFMVLSTASSPILVGTMLDSTFTMHDILYLAIVTTVVSVLLSFRVITSKPVDISKPIE